MSRAAMETGRPHRPERTGRRHLRFQAIALLVGLLGTAIPARAQIAPLESAIAGFVGQTQQGPLDQPTLITSWSEFLSVLSGDTGGLASPYLAPSVQAFFTNGGERLWIVRTSAGDEAARHAGKSARV